jgi:hypothetical protein
MGSQDRRLLAFALYVVFSIATPVLLKCADAMADDSPDQIIAAQAQLAKNMDSASERLDQYGAITISAPLLVRAANDGSASVFEFKLTKGADDYFHDTQNNIQGKVSTFNESLTDVEVQARLSRDSTTAAAYSQQMAERQASVNASSAAQQKAADAAKSKYDAAIAAANAETDPSTRFRMYKDSSLDPA